MPRDLRKFDEGRRLQGIVSQEHLDAFYAYYDHTLACEECSKPGPAHWSEADASWQPTMAPPCATGLSFTKVWYAYLDNRLAG